MKHPSHFDHLLNDMAQFRRENFAAEIKTHHDVKRLHVTHNGFQWTTIELNKEEMEIVKDLLIAELSKENTE